MLPWEFPNILRTAFLNAIKFLAGKNYVQVRNKDNAAMLKAYLTLTVATLVEVSVVYISVSISVNKL